MYIIMFVKCIMSKQSCLTGFIKPIWTHVCHWLKVTDSVCFKLQTKPAIRDEDEVALSSDLFLPRLQSTKVIFEWFFKCKIARILVAHTHVKWN